MSSQLNPILANVIVTPINGTAAAPSIAIGSAASGTGIYGSYGEINYAVNGTSVLTIGPSGIQGPSATYSGTASYQPVGVDLTLGAAAGKTGDTAYLSPIMGNLMGASLTKTGNYLGGLIGAYGITGTMATTYPAGAVLAQISDGVTDVDGAVVAYIDGDSAVTKANAAFKAMANNSNAGSGFNYGLDLTSASHDGFNALAILKADLRLSNDVCVLQGSGAPVDGTTGATFAGPGSLYIRVSGSSSDAYINCNTKASPTWKLITRAA